ncbi:MAG: Ser-Thr-rich GPI-anchored membrane family protein [Candidatus Krumholzibacteriota bacterium]
MRKAIPISALLILMGLLVVQVGCSKDEDPVIPPPTCSITMTTPTGGENFFTGEEIKIRWDRTTGGNVGIHLLKGGNPVGVIIAETENNGFYPWIAATTFGQASGDDYAVRVTHHDDAECTDQTRNFRLNDVSNCSIQFPWQEVGDIPRQTAGTTFEITWTSQNTSGFVDLELWRKPYQDDAFKVEDIGQNLDDTGSFDWVVDSYNLGTNIGFFFKITDLNAPLCTDSSVQFTIVDDEICIIGVGGISDGATYDQGTDLSISFTLTNSSGLVDLRLYSGNVPVDSGLIINGFNTDLGTLVYDWTVTDFGHPGPSFSAFNIRAVDSNDDNCWGKSVNFTIAQ